MLKLKISKKILFSFLVVSLLPLFIVMIFLVISARDQLRQEAVARQQLVATKTANDVDVYLASKINLLIFQSQTSAISKFQSQEASLNLAALMKQDGDLERVSLLDVKGMEKIAFNKQGQSKDLVDASASDAFKATTFLAGKEYIGPVTYNGKGEPLITIAVPLIRFDTQQNLSNLSTAEFAKYRTPEDIQGVLVANYNLSDLWQSVLSTKIGTGGYAYVVDDRGNLIAHPDKVYLSKKQNLANIHSVEELIKGNMDTHETTSERGVQVISSPHPITRSNWGVIVEEPVSSIFTAVDSFIRLCIIIFACAVILAIAISLLFRKQILDPIKKLSVGAQKIGSGDFDYHISLTSKDELGNLANTFNTMGVNIKRLVSDLSRQNTRLAIERTKLNSILRSVSDGVIALNNLGEIISINPPAAKLVGATPDALQGKKLGTTFRWQRNGKPFTPDLDRLGIYHFTELVLADGEKIYYLDLVVSVIERSESAVAAIITIHDLTPARELDVMKLDFVAIAAHELRTPLTVVRGYLNLINGDALKQLSIYNIENLQKALIGADQLSNLINNLLNISRIERGDLNIMISKLDIARLASQIAQQHQATATLKHQKIVYDGPRKDVFVPGDVSAIGEVINNLLGNALKFTPEGGNVHITVSTSNSVVQVEVADNGPGIPVPLRERLFTKFYRVERSLVAGNRGTGLGLYISKTIVDLHHGTIGLKDEERNGSTFYFTLPLFNESKHAGLISHNKESIGIHGWIKKRTNR